MVCSSVLVYEIIQKYNMVWTYIGLLLINLRYKSITYDGSISSIAERTILTDLLYLFNMFYDKIVYI